MCTAVTDFETFCDLSCILTAAVVEWHSSPPQKKKCWLDYNFLSFDMMPNGCRHVYHTHDIPEYGTNGDIHSASNQNWRVLYLPARQCSCTEHARQSAFCNGRHPLLLHQACDPQRSRYEPGWLQNSRRHTAAALPDERSWHWWTEAAYAMSSARLGAKRDQWRSDANVSVVVPKEAI